MAEALPFIPSALSGLITALGKGDKTEFATKQTPEQKLAYTQLLQMLMQRNRQGSDPMNQIRQMFYGQQPPQQPLVGMPDNMGGRERPGA